MEQIINHLKTILQLNAEGSSAEEIAQQTGHTVNQIKLIVSSHGRDYHLLNNLSRREHAPG